MNAHIIACICRRWTKLLETFGGEEGKTVKSYQVRNKQELSDLLDDSTFAKAEVIQLVEVPPPSRPEHLSVPGSSSAASSSYASESSSEHESAESYCSSLEDLNLNLNLNITKHQPHYTHTHNHYIINNTNKDIYNHYFNKY